MQSRSLSTSLSSRTSSLSSPPEINSTDRMAEVLSAASSLEERLPSQENNAESLDDQETGSDTIPRSLPEPEPERPLLAVVPKDVDPTKFKLAYGRRAIPKLVGFSLYRLFKHSGKAHSTDQKDLGALGRSPLLPSAGPRLSL
jgi:hypothetical protein